MTEDVGPLTDLDDKTRAYMDHVIAELRPGGDMHTATDYVRAIFRHLVDVLDVDMDIVAWTIEVHVGHAFPCNMAPRLAVAQLAENERNRRIDEGEAR